MLSPLALVVEDDAALRSVLSRSLREEGFRCEAVDSGARMLERVPAALPDVLIVDIGLPDCDARDACQALRAQGIETPVLSLSARDSLVDRLAGFEAGDDDHSGEALLARRAGGAAAGPRAAELSSTRRLPALAASPWTPAPTPSCRETTACG